MQTPLTILIETLTKKKNAALAESKRLGNLEQSTIIQDAMFAAYADAINEATQLLDIERQGLIDFYNQGSLDTYRKEPKNGQGTTYYNETFKTQ